MSRNRRFHAVLAASGLLVSLVSGCRCFAGDNRWTSNGPYGGQFASFCFHPTKSNVVFANGWSANMFRSRDGGKTWERLQLADTWLTRIHPQAPGVVVAAGTSVFRSTDGGEHWIEIANAPFGGSRLSDLEYHPKDPNTWYGVSWEQKTCRVYKSTDGGKTWTQKNSGLVSGCSTDVCFHRARLEIDPTDGEIIYVLLPSRMVFKSTNGGDSWVSASAGLDFGDTTSANSLVIDPKEPRVLYAGGFPGIFKTLDAGLSWNSADCGCEGVYDIDVDPAHSQNVYAAADKVLKSTNAGMSWSGLALSAQQMLGVAVHPLNSKLILAGAEGDGVLRTQDEGKTWTVVNRGLDAQNTAFLRVDPGNPARMFAVPRTQLYESKDRGMTWNLSQLCRGPNAPVRVRDVQFHPKNPALVVAGVRDERGAVVVSPDGGRTWGYRGTQYHDSFCVRLDADDQNVIYCAPYAGFSSESPPLGIAKSTDQGSTWKLINSGLAQLRVSFITSDPRSSRTLLVGTKGGKVFRSTDGGLHWQDSSAGLGSDAITYIGFDPADSNTACSATSRGTFISKNGGKTWTSLNELGNTFVTFDPTNSQKMFTGGWGGVFFSPDHGQTWGAFDSSGLGPYYTNTLVIDPANNKRFLLGTERGVFSFTRKGSEEGPVVELLLPVAGRVDDTLTVMGRNFGESQGDSRIVFSGGIDAGTAQFWSDTEIRLRVPAGLRTGQMFVRVLNRNSNPFEFIVLPASGSVDPTAGPASGGTRVTILAPTGTSGTQFNVLFGATVAREIRFIEPNIITCSSPPGTGTVEVKVTSSVTSTTVGAFIYQ